MRRVASLGQRGNCKFHLRGFVGCGQPCRSHANLVHYHAGSRSQRLAYAAHTGAAVHAIDLEREFRHLSLLHVFIR